MDCCFPIRCIVKLFPDVTTESLMTGFIKTREMGLNVAANVKAQHLLIKLCYNRSLRGNAVTVHAMPVYIFNVFIDHTQAILSLLTFNI